jgi:hypothetical protein
MRHANSNITMNIYTHAVSSKKRRAEIDDAQDAILSMLGQRTLLQALTKLEIRENGKRQGPLMKNARGSRKPLRQ